MNRTEHEGRVGETRERLCFLIGQMTTETDRSRLDRLQARVLEPVLEDLGYEVVQPDGPAPTADVMRSVLRRIGTAEIVVADLSGNNANAYYELAIRHSLGLPVVIVTEENATKFDIAGLVFNRYDVGHPEHQRKEIGAQLRLAHERALRLDGHGPVDGPEDDPLDNPITNYFGRPLSEVSLASGLALGYVRNFLLETFGEIRKSAPRVEIRQPEHDDADQDGLRSLTEDERKAARFRIWIPDRIWQADHSSIESGLLDRGRIVKARIVKDPRSFPLYALPVGESSTVTFVDIPTAMRALDAVVEARVLDPTARRSPEWRRAERQEIARFGRAVRQHLDHLDPAESRRIEIVQGLGAVSEVRPPGPEVKRKGEAGV